VFVAGAALIGAVVLVHGQFRQHVPRFYSPTAAHAQTAVAPR
jgi:hypothetical protein